MADERLMASRSETMKEVNRAYFRRHRETFLQRWKGLFLLIDEQEVKGVYNEAWEGLFAAAEKGYKTDEFIVYHVN